MPPRTRIEKLGETTDVVRLWLSKAWRIGVMMAKGAYLVGERKRLLLKLGEEALTRIQAGMWKDAELDSTVRQLERLGKKIELEEMLIRNARFGSKGSRTDDTTQAPEKGTE